MACRSIYLCRVLLCFDYFGGTKHIHGKQQSSASGHVMCSEQPTQRVRQKTRYGHFRFVTVILHFCNFRVASWALLTFLFLPLSTGFLAQLPRSYQLKAHFSVEDSIQFARQAPPLVTHEGINPIAGRPFALLGSHIDTTGVTLSLREPVLPINRLHLNSKLTALPSNREISYLL